VGSAREVIEFGFAGENLVTLDPSGNVTLLDETGGERVLMETGDALHTLFAGFVGSDAGAAWVGPDEEIAFADPTGAVTTTELPGLQGDTVSGMGTGGGYVAAGTDSGKVFSWQPGSAPVQVGSMTGAVLTLAAYGGNVLAIDTTLHAQLFTADGRVVTLSNRATPYGAAMNGDYAVWAELTGDISTGVLPGGGAPDTDLYLASLKTGQTYEQVVGRGQQGFPALSGQRLVWQDAANGGNDIFTALLPEGL
jgi:hypothetical protein